MTLAPAKENVANVFLITGGITNFRAAFFRRPRNDPTTALLKNLLPQSRPEFDTRLGAQPLREL